MSTHYEASMQQDIERIRDKVTAMGAMCEAALRNAIRALQERNRQLAYSVILRDQRVDELEKEVDRLCLEFLVKQQPVGAPLRLAYATIRVNLELERIGDYAESIARQVIKLTRSDVKAPVEHFSEITERTIQTLRAAVQAYSRQDPGLAQEAIQLEEIVDALKSRVNAELVQLFRDSKIPLEVLHPLMTIARRLERASDQARSICNEVIYICTGEDTKHPGSDVYRILFIDHHNSNASLMATAIGNALKTPGFVFDSAGIDPRAPEAAMTAFMAEKGIDVSRLAPKSIAQVPHLDEQDVIIALSPEVKKALPKAPRKVVYLDWTIPGSADSKASLAEMHRSIEEQVRELVQAITGDRNS